MAVQLRHRMRGAGAWLTAGVGIARHRIDQAHTSLLMKLSVLTHWIKRREGS